MYQIRPERPSGRCVSCRPTVQNIVLVRQFLLEPIVPYDQGYERVYEDKSGGGLMAHADPNIGCGSYLERGQSGAETDRRNRFA